MEFVLLDLPFFEQADDVDKEFKMGAFWPITTSVTAEPVTVAGKFGPGRLTAHTLEG